MLEARLGVLLEVKVSRNTLVLMDARGLIYIIQEQATLLPLSMRLLYLILFTEIRLLTRSVKRYVPSLFPWFNRGLKLRKSDLAAIGDWLAVAVLYRSCSG